MKQAKIDNILYVFDREPYVITKDTDADIIYVQQECIQGFQELNPSLTLSVYNYSTFQITKPVWYDAYMQEDEEGYTPEAVQPDETNWNIQMFSNGDRGVGLRLTSDNPTVDADRTDLQAAFESIGASSDDYIDDLVGEYDSDLAITPQVSTRGKKNAKSADEEEMTKIEVHKGGFGQYSFHSDNQVIMSVDYSDTSSDECVIDATGLSTGENEVITFSLINKQAITKQEAGIYFSTDEYTVDIHDGTTSAEIELAENPNNLPVEYSVNDPELTLTVESSYITVGQLKEGDFTVTAYTPGNDYFLSGSATASLEVTNITPVVYDDYPIQMHGDQEQEFSDPTDIRVEDITGVITDNITWTETDEHVEYYPESYVPVPYITIYDGDINDNVKIIDYVSLGTLEDSASQAYAAVAAAAGSVVLDSSYWTIKVYIPATDYNGVHYRDKTVTFTDTFYKAAIEYPVSIDGSTTIVFDPSNEPSPQDIEDKIMYCVHDYDDTWMPPIQVYIYKEDSENPGEMIPISEQGYEMYSNDLETDIQTELDESGAVVADITVWYIDLFIPETTYAGEKYNGFGRNVELSFTHVTYHYPVSVNDYNPQVEWPSAGATVSDIENAIAGALTGYDSSWMPGIKTGIYKDDPENPGERITISDGSYELYSNNLETDIQTELNDSGAVDVGTDWYVELWIDGTIYADQEYAGWGYENITLSFVEVPFGNYFRLTSNQNGSTVGWTQGSSAPTITIDYTTDEGATWNQWNYSSITLDEGESACFRSVNNGTSNGTLGTQCSNFVMSGDFTASGNIMSLQYGDDFEGKTSLKGSFSGLFQFCHSLTNAENLLLPATGLVNSCYRNLFYECYFEKAPYLPATSTNPSSSSNDYYYAMFKGCRYLNYVKFNSRVIPSSGFNNWLYGVAATGMLVNENPNFDSSTLPAGASGLPSGWTFYTSDPSEYDASINSSNIDIYPSGESVTYDNISDIVMDIQNNFTCNTSGATPTITIPDPNDQGGSQFVITSTDIDSGASLYDAIDDYKQNYGINSGDVWTATIDIPQDTIDGTLYLAWQGTFTISFQDNP